VSFGGISASRSEAKVYLVIEKQRNNQENSQVCCDMYPTLPWCSMLRSENDCDSLTADVIGDAWAVGIMDAGGT
jgi:hypothetical protein